MNSLASTVRNAIVGGPFGSDLVARDYVEAGVPVIRGQNMGSQWIEGPFVYVTPKKAKSLESNLARPKDVVFTQRGTLGQVSLVPDTPYKTYLVSQSQMKVTLNRDIADPGFIHCWFRCDGGQESIRLNTIQTGVPHINLGILRNLFVPKPPLPEQRAIAEALSDADALIESLDQLIAKKRQIKQGAMQELLTGKRRLPGSSGTWEARRLGDFGACLRGVSYKGDSDLFEHDTSRTKRLLRSNNIKMAMMIIDDLQFVNKDRVSETQILKPRDILICMANGSKDLVGKAGLFCIDDGFDYTFGAFMGCLRIDASLANPDFIFQLFQTNGYRNHIRNFLAGTSINNLRPSSIQSLEFDFPSLTEQTAIATLLSEMDTELAALESRLAKVRQIKQGMMQELLTGRIRLL